MRSMIKISLLIATVAVLGACGVSEEPLSGQAPPPAPSSGTPPPPAPPAVACTAPDPATDLRFSSEYIGPCLLGKTGSARTDIVVDTNSVTEYSFNYASSTVCQGTSTEVTGFYNKQDVGTTTVASLAANGTTTVGGEGYQIQVSLTQGTGTLSAVGTTTLTLCKSTPSAITRSSPEFFNQTAVTFTPTFSIRLSLPNTTTIATTPAFDNPQPSCLYCGG